MPLKCPKNIFRNRHDVNPGVGRLRQKGHPFKGGWGTWGDAISKLLRNLLMKKYNDKQNEINLDIAFQFLLKYYEQMKEVEI
jgi:hypothetical protein